MMKGISLFNVCALKLYMSLCYLLVCFGLLRASYSTPIKCKSNDFNALVRTVNGKVTVTWEGLRLWENTTVLFLSNLYDEISKAKYVVPISVCQAKNTQYLVDKMPEWKVEPTKGNLLKFCNKSGQCNAIPSIDSLVEAKKNGGEKLSCELFTKCVNFKEWFYVQVVSHGHGQMYCFQSKNMTIPTENIPPSGTFTDEKFQYSVQTSPVNLKITYYDPSELCGFGDNPSDHLQFFIYWYKENDTNCFSLGQTVEPYKGNTTKVTFDDIIRGTDIVYFDVRVRSSISKKSRGLVKRFARYSKDNNCSISWGVLSVSWRPRWNCFGENLNQIEQAMFCFDPEDCHSVCEASFYTNGTLRDFRTSSSEFRKACNEKLGEGTCTSSDFAYNLISISWNSETKRLSCKINLACMRYRRDFSMLARTFTENRKTLLNEIPVCPKTNFISPYHRPVPQDVTAVDVSKTEVTITLKFSICESDRFDTNPHIVLNGETYKDLERERNDDFYYTYKYTKKGLRPYQEVTFQAYSYCDYDGLKSERSPLQKLRTKPSVPDGKAILSLVQIRSEGRELLLSWSLPPPQYQQGLPNETRIRGKSDNSTVVYRETVFGVNRTSAVIDINDTQRCAFYEVKFCNAPHLCSNWSNSLQSRSSCEVVPPPSPVPVEPPSSSSVVLIIALTGVFFTVFVIFIVTCLCFRKKRLESRPKLPALEINKDKTGDYIPVGQVSQKGEYESLETVDREDYFEELVT